MYSPSIQIAYQLSELIMGISFLTEYFFFCTELSVLCYSVCGFPVSLKTHSRKKVFQKQLIWVSKEDLES